jgi:formyl-CoA transferase/CoA:oxalate CoA-transferase
LSADGLLSGVRVVDLTQNVAGPFCSQILGDLGAEVIKIERPGVGDDTRHWRPPAVGEESATFLALNRNKLSVAVDIDQPEGADLIRALAAEADVFLQSLKPGSAERRGLGADDLIALNPRLVYAALSAFGPTGPLSALPGYDPLLQAFTGVMSVTGHDGQEPVRAGVSLIDMGTGLWTALGVMGALFRRAQTGRGGVVEASLMETGLSWMTIPASGYFATGKAPKAMGSAMAMTAPYELFRTLDGRIFIAAGNDRLFRAVCAGLGAPELTDDPRFAANPARVANRAALRAAIEALTVSRTTVQVAAALRAAGAPCSELNDVAAALAHPQAQAAGMVRPLPTAAAPDHRVVGLPLRIDGVRGVASTPPPALGADTEAVLAGLGLAATELARLRDLGAVG